MINRQIVGLYSMLSAGEFMTAESLAQTLGVSSKTIRNQLKNLNDLLSEYHSHVEAKHGTGYRLVAENPEELKLLEERLWAYELQKSSLPNSSEERVKYLLDYLLDKNEYVKLDDLSELLYISKKTLTCNLKDVESVLKKYHLSLSRKPNYGILVEGREFDRRLCIAEIRHVRNSILSQLDGERRVSREVQWVWDCIQDCLSRYTLTISNVAYQDLVIHIYIAALRIQGGHFIGGDEISETGLDPETLRMAEEILEKIWNRFRADPSPPPQSEADYIAIHLEGKKTMLAFPSQNGAGDRQSGPVSQEVNDLADYMLDAVYGAFRFDFRGDGELRTSLCLHLIPLLVRLQYGMKLSNPLLKEIKEQYALPYTMATTACLLLSYKYHREVAEDEIGYIALLFALALERAGNEVTKKNVLLVCAFGKASAQLMLYRYKTEFGAYINHIDICDVSRLSNYDLTGIDCIFTVVPVCVKTPVPIYEVRYFLKGADVLAVKRVLQGKYGRSILEIYREELFLPHMKYSGKDEALQAMCDFVCVHGYADEKLLCSVRARESMAKTEFGNMVAMPHPVEMISDRPFVCVALLDEPIRWQEDEPESLVWAIFLVSVANGADYDAQAFYQMTARLFLDEHGMKELIRNQDFKTLESLLQKSKCAAEEG